MRGLADNFITYEKRASWHTAWVLLVPTPLACASLYPQADSRQMPSLPAVERQLWLGEAHQRVVQLSASAYMASPWPPARSAAWGAVLNPTLTDDFGKA